MQVTTEVQRTAFGVSLTEIEDWLYDEGELETGPEFRKRLATLKETSNPMQNRAQVSGQ